MLSTSLSPHVSDCSTLIHFVLKWTKQFSESISSHQNMMYVSWCWNSFSKLIGKKKNRILGKKKKGNDKKSESQILKEIFDVQTSDKSLQIPWIKCLYLHFNWKTKQKQKQIPVKKYKSVYVFHPSSCFLVSNLWWCNASVYKLSPGPLLIGTAKYAK